MWTYIHYQLPSWNLTNITLSAMGKSRSVTIVMAYLLRQNPTHTVSSALDLIRESRPIAEPNDGFMKQLELYKAMGCPRDIESQPRYQRWLYQREVDLALAAGMAPEKVRFEDEEVQDEQEGGGREVELRCRKCRYVYSSFYSYLYPDLPLLSNVWFMLPTLTHLQTNASNYSLPDQPPSKSLRESSHLN